MSQPKIDRQFQPRIEDRELPEEVVEMREEADRLEQQARRALRKAIPRRCDLLRKPLTIHAELLRVPLDTSDLDLSLDTRWAALWPLASRSLSLSLAMVDLAELGYCAEVFPTARTVHETNRKIRAFTFTEGDDAARDWLEGRPPTHARIQKVLRKSDPQFFDETAPPDIAKELAGIDKSLYKLLCGSGHTDRDSTARSISVSTRRITIGPNDDFGMRAYTVDWVSGVVLETVFHAGIVQAIAGGKKLYEEVVQPIQTQLERDIESSAFLEKHLRSMPIEFEVHE